MKVLSGYCRISIVVTGDDDDDDIVAFNAICAAGCSRRCAEPHHLPVECFDFL